MVDSDAGLFCCQAGPEGWQEGNALTASALQAWLIIIQMMEDEDDEVTLLFQSSPCQSASRVLAVVKPYCLLQG